MEREITNGDEAVQRAKAEVQQKIKEVKRKPEAERLPAEKELREELLKELKEKATAASEVREVDKATQGLSIEGKRKEAVSVRVTLVKVLEAVKEGIITPPGKTRVIFTELAERGGLTDTTASYLQPILAKYIEKEINFSKKGQELTEFEKDFRQLKKDNPHAARLLGQILIDKVGELGGITEEDLRTQLNLKGDEEAIVKEESRQEDRFEALFIRDHLGDFYQEEDKEVLRAIYSKEAFKEFVSEIKEEVERENPDLSEEEKGKEISRRVERAIGRIFTKLFLRVDEASPSKLFEDVIKEGSFLSNIEVIFSNLRNKIQVLKEYFSNHPEELGDVQFYIRYSEGQASEITGLSGQTLPVYVVEPYYSLKRVEHGGAFLNYLYRQTENIFDWGRYKHNIKAIFTKGMAGEKGFWSEVARYADSLMRTTDFEHVNLLYNNDLTLEALRLYNQYLYEELGGLYNWIHQPALFAVDTEGFNHFEREAFDKLKEIYKEKLNKGELSEWELRSALSSAVGMSLGVLLSEVEIAAQADPSLTYEGKPDYRSLWRSDTTALTVFAPGLFNALRWQAEGTTYGPMAFLPIPDPKKVKKYFSLFYNHQQVYDDIVRFYQSFAKGLSAFPKGKKGFKSFIDIVNPGRVGSFFTRGGWRDFYGYEAWVGEKSREEGVWIFDFATAFKRLDSIGFEFLLDLTSNQFKGFYSSKPEERELLLKFIYDTYFRVEDYETKDFNVYKTERLKEFKKKGLTETDFEMDFMKEALARIFVLRLPAKYLAMERNRLSPTGKRMWERIRIGLGVGVAEMDQIVKDLILAQNELRKDISYSMDKKMAEGGDLAEVAGKYFLTEEKIRSYLGGLGVAEERIDKVIKLYKLLLVEFINNKEVIRDFGSKLFARGDNFPFALAPEEADFRYFGIRGTGERTITRTLTDTALIEQKVAYSFSNLMEACRNTATSGKRDFGEIVKVIAEAKKAIEQLHGKEVANQFAYYLAYATICYFQKDTLARVFGGAGGWGKINSIAGEFAGGSRVWEWEAADIGRFIYSLEVAGALEKQPYELQKPPSFESFGERMKKSNYEVVKKMANILAKPLIIKIKDKEIDLNPFNWKFLRKKDFEIYSATLKKFGFGALMHKIFDVLISYTPVALIIVLIFMLSKAFKESFGEKK